MSKMTAKEAGSLGGLMTRKRHDKEFYVEIGKKGGAANARRILEKGISAEERLMFSAAGKKGGEQTKKIYGTNFYRIIGRKGGKSRPKK